MERGYIRLWRAIEGNELWKEKPFSRAQAWIDLIMMARHEDGDIVTKRGFRIKAKRGDVLYGLEFLKHRWDWGKGKVVRFREYLLSQDMVRDVRSQRVIADTRGKTDPKTDPKFNILNIQNYNKYQDTKKPKRTPNGPN